MQTSIVFGRLNLIAGGIFLLLAAMGGMALGFTFDQHSIEDGYHKLSEIRFYLREGHSHGMPMAMLNLIVGVTVDRLALSDKLKRITSILAVLTIFLPIGLALKGAFGAPANFPPVGMLGVLGFVGAAVLVFIGAVKIPAKAA